MIFSNLINWLWLQLIWFAAVMGAAIDVNWPAPVLLIFFMYWASRPKNLVKSDFLLLPVAVLLGIILDTTWIKLGWLAYSGDVDRSNPAPVWILSLWAGLALTINHSLAWLRSKLWLAAILSAIASPLSYLGAAKLGAVKILPENYVWAVGIGASWAIVIPLLLGLGQYLQYRTEEQNLYE